MFVYTDYVVISGLNRQILHAWGLLKRNLLIKPRIQGVSKYHFLMSKFQYFAFPSLLMPTTLIVFFYINYNWYTKMGSITTPPPFPHPVKVIDPILRASYISVGTLTISPSYITKTLLTHWAFTFYQSY